MLLSEIHMYTSSCTPHQESIVSELLGFVFLFFFSFQVLKILSGNSFQECRVLGYAPGSRASLSLLEQKKPKAKQTHPPYIYYREMVLLGGAELPGKSRATPREAPLKAPMVLINYQLTMGAACTTMGTCRGEGSCWIGGAQGPLPPPGTQLVPWQEHLRCQRRCEGEP